jgi:hypothetical protein
MVAADTLKGDSFVAGKPRLWCEERLGGAIDYWKNVDLAPENPPTNPKKKTTLSASAAVQQRRQL